MALLLPQSEKSWDSRADLVPSLYVFECVELELALTLAAGDDDPLDSDFSCPIRLHRGNGVLHVRGRGRGRAAPGRVEAQRAPSAL